PLHAAAPELLGALEALERAQLVKEEYYRQCDLGQPPSKGWEKLNFTDVTATRLRANELSRAAIEEAKK
ncbi:hypothetical protein LCGC14_2019990, partial [marine sediment metagenome]